MRHRLLGVRAHPRGCGEHAFAAISTEAVHGLIPAGAGNINDRSKSERTRRAHPRGCGEHILASASLFTSWWLIPAGAGNIWYLLGAYAIRRAHPRGCGEHFSTHGTTVRYRGSSPRVRGTYFLTWGFTPIPQVLVLV